MDQDDAAQILLRNLGFRQPGLRADRLVEKLRDPSPSNVRSALENLSSTLLMSREEGLVTFPTAEVLPELIEMLRSPPPYPEIPVLATRVITQLIDRGVPDILDQLVDNGILDALNTRFQDMCYVDIVEQAIVILERVAQVHPAEVLTSGCPMLCLQFIDFFNMHIQKSILTVVAICCSAVSSDNMEDVRLIVPILEEHMSNCGQGLIDLSISGVAVLIQAVATRAQNPRAEIRNTFSENIATILTTRLAPGDPLLPKALIALDVLVENMPQLIPELINTHVPTSIAYALTSVPDITGKNSYDVNEVFPAILHCPHEALSAAMCLLGALLPSPKLNRPFDGPYQRPNYVDKAVLTDVPVKSIEQFATTTIQLAKLIHSCCSDLQIRKQALLDVLQVAKALPKKAINTIADSSDIVSFVCLVISQADSLGLVIGGLEVCAELIEKLPDTFIDAFVRQGIVSELEVIISNCPEPENQIPKSWSFDGDNLEPVASYVAKGIYTTIKASIPESVGTKADVLARLKAGTTDVWPEIADLVHEKSMLELSRLDAFSIIAEAILRDSTSFLNAFTPQHYRELVIKLGEAVSRTERCGVLSTSDGPILSLVNALNRHVRVCLKDANNGHSWPLNVQGIASIKNLEEFCQSRLAFLRFMSGDENLFAALNGQRRHMSDNEQLGEDDGDEVDEGEGANSDISEDSQHHEEEEFTDSENELVFGHNHDHNDEELQSMYDDEDADMGDHDELHHQVRVEEQPVDETEEDYQDGEEEDEELQENAFAELVELERENDDGDDDDEEENGGLGRALGRIRGSGSATDAMNSSKPNLNFFYEGRPLHSDMSVLGAIYNPSTSLQSDGTIPRSVWENEFTITFERADRPNTSKNTINADTVDTLKDVPKSLGTSPELKSSIRLLNILHMLNEKHGIIKPSDFINVKLTSKLNRQLEDPLVVIANILPQWVVDTVRIYAFLYPFESRYLFVKSTSFGYSRSMSRWQNRNEDQNFRMPRMSVGRVVKQKYRIARKGLLTNALKVLSMTSRMAAMIEIEYYNEQGTGLGPTLEFYSGVSKEFQRENINMWRGDSINGYVFDPNGLFPSPMAKRNKQVLGYFTGLGRFVARALLDERLMDLRINPVFFILILGHEFYEPKELMKLVDPVFTQQLYALEKSTVEQLDLDFTLPSYDNIELLPGGRDQLVTGPRLQEYIDLVVDWTIFRGISRQIEAFREGFSECIPVEALNAFLPVDFSSICGQNQESWDQSTLSASLKADHGYTMDSKPVLQLIDLMSKFTMEERRKFLQFMTGSPNLPIGGFKSLNPAFTVVLKHGEDANLSADDYFPSVMTCANYLKLPAYSSSEVMSSRLWGAIEGGSGVFPLS